jgi:hypothetical protein
LEEIPFFTQPVKIATAMKSNKGAQKWTNDFIESILVPPDLRKISKSMDKAGGMQIPRQTDTLMKMLQADIPGQLSKMNLDMKKVNKLQLDQLAVLMENAPYPVRLEVKPTFAKKFRSSRGLDPEERERYVDILKDMEE